jgi:hypothetical protein
VTISLTNAGRGSGKTHDLIEWAKESPNRYVIGLHQTTGDAMEDAGLTAQFVHFADAKQFFLGRKGYDVAIDNLHMVMPSLLHSEYGISPEADVIMTSTFPEANMGRTREVPFVFATEALDKSIEFMENLKTIFGDKKFTKEDQ